jgi:hypothetical protein
LLVFLDERIIRRRAAPRNWLRARSK